MNKDFPRLRSLLRFNVLRLEVLPLKVLRLNVLPLKVPRLNVLRLDVLWLDVLRLDVRLNRKRKKRLSRSVAEF
jgi:hypothetical protein